MFWVFLGRRVVFVWIEGIVVVVFFTLFLVCFFGFLGLGCAEKWRKSGDKAFLIKRSGNKPNKSSNRASQNLR